jgi:hypothetical protein
MTRYRVQAAVYVYADSPEEAVVKAVDEIERFDPRRVNAGSGNCRIECEETKRTGSWFRRSDAN